METTNIIDFTRRDKMTDALMELLRTGVQDMIAQALEANFQLTWRSFLRCARRLATLRSLAMATIQSAQFKKVLAL